VAYSGKEHRPLLWARRPPLRGHGSEAGHEVQGASAFMPAAEGGSGSSEHDTWRVSRVALRARRGVRQGVLPRSQHGGAA
jgi:hypothetical protein